MNTFSFKAECPADVDAFLLKMEGKHTVVKKEVDEEFYDTTVELHADESLEKLTSILESIEDSDVMLETLSQVPLGQNQLIIDHLG